MQVFVRDNNVDQALRALKRKMQREGVFREMKRRKAMKNRRSARPARKQKPFDEQEGSSETGPARRFDPYAQTAGGGAPSGTAAQIVLSLAANTFLTLCVMHNGAALAVRLSLTRGRGRPLR